MAEDDDRREDRVDAGRRASARIERPEPPVIDAKPLDEEPATGATDPADRPSFHDRSDGSGFATSQVPPDPTPQPAADVDQTATGPAGVEPAWSRAEPGRDSTPSERDRRPSIIPALVALVVAILAAGWVYLYNQMTGIEGDAQRQVADLRARLDAVEARPVPDTSALTKRVDTVAAEAQARSAALGKRIDELPPGGNDPKEVAALQAQVADLKQLVTSVQGTVATLPKPDLSRIESRLGDLDRQVATLTASVGAIPHVDLGPLTAKVDALDGRLKPVESETEASRSPQRVAERQAAPVAVTAQAIVAAIQSGQAFPQQLKALVALGADPGKLAPLQPVAASGAPTLGDLQANLADLRERMISQGAPPPSGSYMDRLMAGANALVQVRPVGSVVGDTPAAIVARMNESIGADNLDDALAAWNRLPEASRAVSKGLVERIRLRLDAENAARAIAANAIDALAPPRG